MWKNCDGTKSVDDIVSQLISELEVTGDEIYSERELALQAFEKLVERGLIDYG